MINNSQKNKTPKLRFHEFDGEWEEEVLEGSSSEILELSNTKLLDIGYSVLDIGY